MNSKIIFSNEVQLRLHMTSEQINDQRERDSLHMGAMVEGEQKRVRRLFDTEVERPWKGVVRSRAPYTKGRFHYRYHAALLHDISLRKEDPKIRRYYKRRASKLEEKADETVS